MTTSERPPNGRKDWHEVLAKMEWDTLWFHGVSIHDIVRHVTAELSELRDENANLKAVLKGRSDIDDKRFEMAMEESAELRAEADELEKQMHDWVFETDDDVKKENLTLRAELATLRKVAEWARETRKVMNSSIEHCGQCVMCGDCAARDDYDIKGRELIARFDKLKGDSDEG